MKTQLDDWLVRRLMAGWTPKALAASCDGRISGRTFYRWRKTLGLEVVEMGGYRATFVLRGDGPPSQLNSWQRIVEKPLAPADGTATVSPETESSGPEGTTPQRAGARRHCVTGHLRDISYTSRKAQASPNRRSGDTGLLPAAGDQPRNLPHRLDTSWSPQDGEAAAGVGLPDRGKGSGPRQTRARVPAENVLRAPESDGTHCILKRVQCASSSPRPLAAWK